MPDARLTVLKARYAKPCMRCNDIIELGGEIFPGGVSWPGPSACRSFLACFVSIASQQSRAHWKYTVASSEYVRL
jgi:hypothetical protein